MSTLFGSPMTAVYSHLRAIHPNWFVEFGRREGEGWIPGEGFRAPIRGPLLSLLERIGARLRTSDRGIVAAAFGLGFGRSAAVAVAPYVVSGYVPDLRLENASFKFDESTMFERVSLHRPRGTVGKGTPRDLQGQVLVATSDDALRQVLRDVLVEQCEPVVEAVHAWSAFPRKSIWAQLVASWGAQFVNVFAHLGEHPRALPELHAFFDDGRVPFTMRPDYYAVTHETATRICSRRGACCFYHKIPEGRNCVSCPLLAQQERLRRNVEAIAEEIGPASRAIANKQRS